MSIKGAGVRWTPLHFNAEAPTEPAGETAVALATEGIEDTIITQTTARRKPYITEHRAPSLCS